MSAANLTILTSDSHAGAPTDGYREYLEAAWHDEFDAWRDKYRNPFTDLTTGVKNRNWDFERRTAEQYADGVVGEVVFPNTVPPFFPTGILIAPPPSERSYEKRLAGIRAHNRWLRDFCDELPGQRIGLPQVFLNNIDDAVADAHWAAENGFTSILVPSVPPDSGIDPLFTNAYDPLWEVCQDLDLVVTQHGGGGLPSYRRSPATPFLMLMEVKFFSNRSFWHLLLTGVFERFPRLKFVLTEQGVEWVGEALGRMDAFWQQVKDTGRVGELNFSVDDVIPRPPSEYFAQNCWIGASFPAPSDAAHIRDIGIDRIMWGSDYPHDEGTYPHSRESLRRTFEGFSEEELRKLLAGTAANLYRADLSLLDAVAVDHGPTVEEIQTPLDVVPDNDSPAFTRA